MEKIFKVVCNLTWKEFAIRVIEISAEKTKAGYRYPDDYLKGSKFVAASKLMKVDSMFYNRITGHEIDNVCFFTICLEANIALAIALVQQAVVDRNKELFSSATKLNKKISGEPTTTRSVYDPEARRK